MDFTLDSDQQRRFTTLIQQHRKRAGLHQWKVAEDIKLAGDLRSEISRFEKAHPNVMARWLTEPYLSAVAAAYRFDAPADLLELFERARDGIVETAPDPWHPAFPGISVVEAEVPRSFGYATNPLLVFTKRGGPDAVVAELPADIGQVTVVVDFTSGVSTVRRQLQAAWAARRPEAPPLDLHLVDSATLRELPAPAVYVDDWSLEALSTLVRRLVEAGLVGGHQASRVERMFRQAPERSVAGLPISLVIEAVAAEARAEGAVGSLHKRLVAAEWERGVRVPAGAVFSASDIGVYTDFWAEVAVRSGAADWSTVEEDVAVAAAGRVLSTREWHAPDGAELARRMQAAAEVSSRPKRKEALDDVAAELLRPGARRLVELFVQMGLIRRQADRLQAANPAVATLAAAWGLAENPERLAEHPSVLCLPSAGRLLADMAVFEATPTAVRRALASTPAWAASDRDHACMRFVAATPNLDGVVRCGLLEAWSRVVYERSGPGRWFERIWANGPATRELDLALRVVSERFRAQLPVFAALDELLALVPEAERARIDGEVLHPIIQEPTDPPRSLASVAQVAPWQCPILTFTELDGIENPRLVRPGLGPLPDPREVAAAAAIHGFEAAKAWLAGEVGADSLFQRLPLAARLLCLSRATSPEPLARARDEVLWLLRHGGIDRDALHRPIALLEERLPLLHAALGLDQAPITLWQVAVSVLRRTGGMPRRSTGFSLHEVPDLLRVELAEALDDVAELRTIEEQVDRRIRAGRVSTHVGTVTAFGADLSSRHARFPSHKTEPTEHPLQQLTRVLSADDDAGHAAAVALFERGEDAPLRCRSRGDVAVVSEHTRRAWLDAWRLADLWDAPLERIRACLPADDAELLSGAVAGDEWGPGVRNRADHDVRTLQLLGIERPDLAALAAAYSRLRYCRAGAPAHQEIDQLALPMDDRLAAFCDGINDARPAELDLRSFYATRATRALRVLAESGDEATLRAWNNTYRARRIAPDPTTLGALLPYEPALGAVRIVDTDPREGIVGRAVGEALKASAHLRNIAWRFADEPDAADELLTWALDAGEPYPTWVRVAVDREASQGRGWRQWRDLPAFRRQRLTWLRSREHGEAASLVCISFAEIAKDGPDDVVAEAAGVVLDWVGSSAEPFRPPRRLVFERLAHRADAASVNGEPEVLAAAPDPGPAWDELLRFLEAALRDRRCPRERVVAAIERLWDILVAAPITHDTSLIEGEPVHLQIHEGSRDVFDDVARLLLQANAPGRIERLLREGVPPQQGDNEASIEAAISAGYFPMLAGLPDGTRSPRTRAEVLQLRVLARFPPPGLDPRSLLSAGDMFEDWVWLRLASRGDGEALDRMQLRLADIDLGDPRWLDAEPVLSALIRHRREEVVRWLLAEAARSPQHEEEARGVVVGWLHAWGDRGAELAAWARGGPVPASPQ